MAKTHKTIFGTTEKSNFILNMTNDQFNKTASVLFTVGFSLIFIFSAIAEILSNASLSEAAYDWKIIPSVALGITGILSVSIFIIALIKQTLDKKQIAGAVIALVLTVCMYISYVNAINTIPDYSAFLGFRHGRYEGLMVLLSYLFIFLGSMTINKEKTVNNIFRVFSVIMIIECVWSGLQFIPSFPGHYYQIPYLIKNPMLPSGTAGSPVFLAVLLSAGLTISALGAMHEKSSAYSVIYKISVLPVSFFLVKTQTLIGYISSVLILMIILTDFIRTKKKEKTNSTPIILMITGFAAALVFIFIKGFAVYDGEVIWQDGCRRLAAFGQYTASYENSFDIHNVTEVYPFLWDKAAEIIKQFPVTGIGPDAFVFSQRSGSFNDVPLSVDRPYNEYLFYAATLGIPSAVSLAAVMIYSAVNGIKSAVNGKGWIFTAAMSVSVLFILTSFITNNTAAVTPFIWFIIGICCCTFSDKTEK